MTSLKFSQFLSGLNGCQTTPITVKKDFVSVDITSAHSGVICGSVSFKCSAYLDEETPLLTSSGSYEFKTFAGNPDVFISPKSSNIDTIVIDIESDHESSLIAPVGTLIPADVVIAAIMDDQPQKLCIDSRAANPLCKLLLGSDLDDIHAAIDKHIDAAISSDTFHTLLLDDGQTPSMSFSSFERFLQGTRFDIKKTTKIRPNPILKVGPPAYSARTEVKCSHASSGISLIAAIEHAFIINGADFKHVIDHEAPVENYSVVVSGVTVHENSKTLTSNDITKALCDAAYQNFNGSNVFALSDRYQFDAFTPDFLAINAFIASLSVKH